MNTKPIAFVTGGTGFIGSHLVDRLLSKGYTVRCLVRNPQKLGFLKGLPIEIFEGDLFTTSTLEKGIEGAQYVFHVAGVVAAKKKEEFYRYNRDGTKNIIEVTARVNPNVKKFIHISSQTAVGPGDGKTPVTESTPTRPITTYGKSKLASELEVLKLKEKIPVTILRVAAVYGPRDTATFDYFKSAYMGLELMIGFHDTYVSLVHAHDIVSGIVLAAESTKSAGQIYFLGSEKFYTWNEIGYVTRHVLNKKLFRVRVPKPLVFVIAGISGFASKFKSKPSVLNFEKAYDLIQDNWCCDITKAKTELGYQPEVTLEEGVKETVKWYLDHKWM
ncbi:MAG: NAD-dependent epimerase/dehydratase family protein [Ignavibacteriales bacterium]|nr:NAD-dependent epimerase/dehydratase family protein [Ignavibacteriales bacterium]